MKKVKLLFGLLIMLSISLISCDKDDDPSPKNDEGSYSVIIGGKTFTGKSHEVGYIQNGVSIGGEDFAVLLSDVPMSGTKDIDGSDCAVSIYGKNILNSEKSLETYISFEGSITRVSDTKFSFKGNARDASDLTSNQTYPFEGSIECEAYKAVK